MTGFRVGVGDGILVARPEAETFNRAGYLNAVANRVDSFWVPATVHSTHWARDSRAPRICCRTVWASKRPWPTRLRSRDR